MGPSLSTIVAKKGKEVKEKFQGQRYVLIGESGSGKSSLINTFNHAINLSCNPLAVYKDIAETGGGEAAQKTIIYDTFSGEKQLYSEMGRDDRLRKDAPTFYDVPGIPDREEMWEIILDLALGKVEEGTEVLKGYTKAENPSKDRSWAILFVLPFLGVNRIPEGLCFAVNKAMGDITRRRLGKNFRLKVSGFIDICLRYKPVCPYN